MCVCARACVYVVVCVCGRGVRRVRVCVCMCLRARAHACVRVCASVRAHSHTHIEPDTASTLPFKHRDSPLRTAIPFKSAPTIKGFPT